MTPAPQAQSRPADRQLHALEDEARHEDQRHARQPDRQRHVDDLLRRLLEDARRHEREVHRRQVAQEDGDGDARVADGDEVQDQIERQRDADAEQAQRRARRAQVAPAPRREDDDAERGGGEHHAQAEEHRGRHVGVGDHDPDRPVGEAGEADLQVAAHPFGAARAGGGGSARAGDARSTRGRHSRAACSRRAHVSGSISGSDSPLPKTMTRTPAAMIRAPPANVVHGGFSPMSRNAHSGEVTGSMYPRMPACSTRT